MDYYTCATDFNCGIGRGLRVPVANDRSSGEAQIDHRRGATPWVRKLNDMKKQAVLKTFSGLLTICFALALTLSACKHTGEHPQGEHPRKEHPGTNAPPRNP